MIDFLLGKNGNLVRNYFINKELLVMYKLLEEVIIIGINIIIILVYLKI